VLLASAVPVKVGVVSLVKLSLFDVPVSEVAAKSGVDGAAGAEASMLIDKAEDAFDIFPAASVALAVMAWLPFERALLEPTVKLQFPLLSAVVVPKELLPSKSSTVLLASAVPVKVGVVSLVKLSLFDVPVSELASRSGVDGV
jgi:hypothetical protein